MYSMKAAKTQPTSYKDFIDKINEVKTTKISNQYKIKQTPRPNNSSTSNLHSQSTSIWDKRSPSHNKRLITDVSSSKRLKNSNKTHNETSNPSHNTSHNHSINNLNQSSQYKISRKDKALSYQKFIVEATTLLSTFTKSSIPELLSNRISYIQYLEVLKSLKFIYDNYQPYPSDLISQLWAECISGQNIGNFVITLCAILGLSEGKPNQSDRYLRKKYQSLKYTRMELNKGNSTDMQKQNQCTFMPQISDRSRKLASASKQKKSNRHNMQSINTDRALTDRNNNSVAQFQKSKMSLQSEQTNNFYLSNNDSQRIIKQKSKTDLTGNKRSQILYERAKQKSCQRRQNKSTNQIQYQKGLKELTFKPTILKMKAKDKDKDKDKDKEGGNKEKVKCSVKGEKNTISRMIRGRVEREVRRIINEKGVPYNQKIVDKMRKQKYEQIVSNTNLQQHEEPQSYIQSPLVFTSRTKQQKQTDQQLPCPPRSLPTPINIVPPEQDIIIDVYLSQDHKQKLIVRKGQSLQQIALNFINEHKIPLEKKEQLLQLLQVSLSHALTPIDELVEEEDQLASARTHYKRDYH